MQVNLNSPAIERGHLTADQLDRRVNPGRIYALRDHKGDIGAAMLMPAGLDEQGRYPTRAWGPAEACSEFLEDDADPRASALFWNVYAVVVFVAVASAVAYFY